MKIRRGPFYGEPVDTAHARLVEGDIFGSFRVGSRATCDRACYLGDPAFVQIPDKLITREYAHQLAGTIDLGKATRSEALSGNIVLST